MIEIDDTPVRDTKEMRDIPGIGFIENGALVTYHVTDDPERVRRMLARGDVRLMAAYGKAGQHSELGSGLYVSGNPDFWVGRARGKWDFLKTLSGDKLHLLLILLRDEIEDLKKKKWLSSSEYERGIRDLKYVEDGHYDATILTMFAGQPYNIAFWKPEVLKPLGIEPGRKPRVLEIRVAGELADIRGGYSAPLFRRLRRAGVVGAYTRASMATNPELVIWNPRAVKSVREVEW